jgi:hypothetical protein
MATDIEAIQYRKNQSPTMLATDSINDRGIAGLNSLPGVQERFRTWVNGVLVSDSPRTKPNPQSCGWFPTPGEPMGCRRYT